MRIALLIVLALCCFTACTSPPVYEDNISIDEYDWFYKDTLSFSFELKDTSQRYNFFINVRHTDAFDYANLWVNVETVYPNGESQSGSVNLPMADKKGKWYGSGLGDIFSNETLTNEVMIQQNAQLPLSGTYQFKISQFMRVDPLPNVMDIGVIIRKAEEG